MKSITYITILGLPVSIFGRHGRHGGGHISSVPPARPAVAALQLSTLYNTILRIARNFLETRDIK